MLLRIVLLISVAVIVSTQNEVKEKRLVLHNDEAVASAIQTMSAQIAVLTANLTETNRKLAESTANLTETNRKLAESTAETNRKLAESTANLTETNRKFVESTAETNRKLAEATANLTETNRKLTETTKSLSNKGIGSTYVRWGRTTCPSNGTDLVYKGFVGGSHYTETGGTADYICLSGEPLWGFYDNTDHTISSKLYGAEYEFAVEGFQKWRCPTSIMIPGLNQCYPGWTMEYAGYLVGGAKSHPAPSNYACLDARPETELGDVRNDDGKLMYLVGAVCPPYVQKP